MPASGQYSGPYMQNYGTQRGPGQGSTSGSTTYQVVSGYPSIGPSGDGYPQTQPPGGYQPTGGVGPTGYQPQTDMGSAMAAAAAVAAAAPAPQGSYSQYPTASGAPSCSQPSYVQQQQQQQQQQQTPGSVYYSSATPCSNGAAAAMTFPTMGQSQGSYRPRTPPNQSGTGNLGGIGPSVSVNGVGVMGVSASGQYVSYPGPSPGAPYPQPVAQRPQASQVLPYQSMPHTHSPPQPPFPVVRPNMQMSMQMQTRTTPPPPPGGQYSHVAMVPASSQQVKIYGVDQRPPKSVDLYNPELNKDGGALSLQAPQVVALPKGGTAVSVRSAGPPYRAPTPMCPGKLRRRIPYICST